MASDNARSNSSNLIAEAKAIADNAQTTFGSLTAQQINWKPSADQWSIGQCFDHLFTANRCYFPVIETIIRGEKKSTVWERLPFLPDVIGKMLIKYLAPRSTRKLKAPTIFKPSSGAVDANIINRFHEEQARLILLMEKTRGLDAHRIKITSPVSRFITYSLSDAYKIILTHEQRHFLQAQRVLESEGFPG